MISVDDKFGVSFVTGKDWNMYIGYYQTLIDMAPILQSDVMDLLFTGYYLNIDHDGHSVRVSYFVKEDLEQPKAFKEVCNMHNFLVRRGTDLTDITLYPRFPELELRFRYFLKTYTQIGLDLIYADDLKVYKLFFEFRGEVYGNYDSYRKFFEPTFKRLSPYYNNMHPQDKQQFWNDIHMHGLDWIHMMVNMIICGDLELDPRKLIEKKRFLGRKKFESQCKERFRKRKYFKNKFGGNYGGDDRDV